MRSNSTARELSLGIMITDIPEKGGKELWSENGAQRLGKMQRAAQDLGGSTFLARRRKKIKKSVLPLLT
jgi:hypothetical protein